MHLQRPPAQSRKMSQSSKTSRYRGKYSLGSKPLRIFNSMVFLYNCSYAKHLPCYYIFFTSTKCTMAGEWSIENRVTRPSSAIRSRHPGTLCDKSCSSMCFILQALNMKTSRWSSQDRIFKLKSSISVFYHFMTILQFISRSGTVLLISGLCTVW